MISAQTRSAFVARETGTHFSGSCSKSGNHAFRGVALSSRVRPLAGIDRYRNTGHRDHGPRVASRLRFVPIGSFRRDAL